MTTFNEPASQTSAIIPQQRRGSVERAIEVYHDPASTAPASRFDMRIIWIM